ncbi:MAG: hypothetical protein VX015_00285 [Planctomycetota bacterium]|nr:hypothetical protein [Planctomycetota bacterium]
MTEEEEVTQAADPGEGIGESRSSAPARQPRRWLARLSAALVLASGALLVAGPGLISSWARARAEEAIGARIDGHASIAELRVGLNGKVRLSGLELTDPAGQLVVLVPEARFDLGVRSLLLGKRDIALLVTGVQVELVQGEDGRWNVEELFRTDEAVASGDAGGEGREPLPETSPDLEGRLELLGATVTVRSPRSVLELRDVDLRVGLDGDAREFSVEGGARLAGGDGDAGTLLLDGALWPDARAGLRIDELSLRGLELGAVQEALRLVGRPLEEGSRLEGDVDLVAYGSFTGFDPAGRFGFEAEVVGRDVEVARVEGGKRVFAFDDREPRAFVAVERALPGAQPTALLDLNARGGDVIVQGGWDGAAEPAISAAVSLRDLDASTGLDRWIARVHPALASTAALRGAAVEGLVSADVAVSYDGALTFEDLRGGAPDLDPDLVSVTGDLSIAEAAITSSPLFSELLTALGEPAVSGVDLAPLGFRLAAGRITYTRPWTWTISGTQTRFEGGVGLDGALELLWVVPVTADLAGRSDLLRTLAGETLVVPLGGTLDAPRLDLTSALGQIAVRAAEGEARALLEDAIGDEAAGVVDGLLGGGGEAALQDAARLLRREVSAARLLGGSADAATLLREADARWNDGRRAEAAGIYRRLRDEYPLTAAYLMNEKRIEARAKE